jgi:type II secretory ATPase GspE/PulE/Tfp pilus assembly ATPase PilB-like protein
LRQDPDVIMVGEIRDSDTAIMATDAAMTGHLVFSTLHTNNAPSVFVRLLEMSVEDFVIASTVNFIIAQRLVRKICTHCAQQEILTDSTYKKIMDRSDILHILNKDYNITPEELKTRTFKKGAGCTQCFQSGYVGRIGIYECLELNKEIHDMILAQKSSENIKEAAERNGFKDMVSDGILKVIDGATTFDEVIRTTKNV